MEGAKIVAIDDQDDNLALLETLLVPQGVDYHAAEDGASGLALIRQVKPDLVLLDLAMPVMDGFEVLERLRADPATRRVPVIVLTANFREAKSVQRGFEAGATEYLTKPLQLDELLVRIRTILRLSRAERELERMRRDFASMLVHDMRAPLDGARLALATLRRGETDPGRLELFGLALGALDEAGTLVEDLLHVNRLEEEGFAAQPEPVELTVLVAASLEALRPIAAARGLDLRASVDPGTVALADPRLLRRVLDNLVANALKFTERGEVRVEARSAEGLAQLTIADTGPGIPADELPRIFDRYFHGQRRKDGHQGSFGLGLAFCHQAVVAMAGSIAVQSTEGLGTTFRVGLPLGPSVVAADASRQPLRQSGNVSPPPIGGTPLRRILIAADDTRCSLEAVRQGAAAWLPPHSVVQVLSVIPNACGDQAPGPYYHRAAESAQAALDQALDQLERAGHRAEGCIRVGDPAATIASAAREFEADLILIGTRGFRPGSVAEAVSRTATCGVLICRLQDRSVAC